MTNTPVSPAPRSTLREAGGAATAQTVAFALSLITGPILARTLGDAGRGEMAAVVVPVQLFSWIIIFGLPYAATQLIDRFGRDRVLRAAWLSATIITVCVSIPLIVFSQSLRSEISASSMWWFRIGLLVAPLSIPSAVTLRLRLISEGAGWTLAVTSSLYLYTFSIAVVLLALLDQLRVSTALAAWVLSFLLQPVFVLIRHGSIQPPSRSLADVVTGIKVGAPYALGSISSGLLGRIDQVAMASTVSLEELGTYAVAATAAQATLPVARGIADTTFARKMRTLDSTGLPQLTFALSAAASLAMAVIAPFLIPLLFGQTFEPSVRLLQLLLPGQVAFNTGLVVGQSFDADGRPEVAGRALAATCVVNLALVVPVTSAFGPTGAAVLTSGCQILFATIVGITSSRGKSS